MNYKRTPALLFDVNNRSSLNYSPGAGACWHNEIVYSVSLVGKQPSNTPPIVGRTSGNWMYIELENTYLFSCCLNLFLALYLS